MPDTTENTLTQLEFQVACPRERCGYATWVLWDDRHTTNISLSACLRCAGELQRARYTGEKRWKTEQ